MVRHLTLRPETNHLDFAEYIVCLLPYEFACKRPAAISPYTGDG